MLVSFFEAFGLTLECLFFRFLNWGGSVPAPVRSHLMYFSMMFVKNDVLPARELIFQLELSSRASNTAVFNF